MMRVGTTVAALVMDHHGVYQEGAWDPRYGFVWCFVFNAISQAFALYTLIKFYHATHKDLEAIRPFGKFICIKAVIFLSWWQAIAVSTLVHQKELHKTTPFEANEVAKAIQDILICMEMFLASIAYSCVTLAYYFFCFYFYYCCCCCCCCYCDPPLPPLCYAQCACSAAATPGTPHSLPPLP